MLNDKYQTSCVILTMNNHLDFCDIRPQNKYLGGKSAWLRYDGVVRPAGLTVAFIYLSKDEDPWQYCIARFAWPGNAELCYLYFGCPGNYLNDSQIDQPDRLPRYLVLPLESDMLR